MSRHCKYSDLSLLQDGNRLTIEKYIKLAVLRRVGSLAANRRAAKPRRRQSCKRPSEIYRRTVSCQYARSRRRKETIILAPRGTFLAVAVLAHVSAGRAWVSRRDLVSSRWSDSQHNSPQNKKTHCTRGMTSETVIIIHYSSRVDSRAVLGMLCWAQVWFSTLNLNNNCGGFHWLIASCDSLNHPIIGRG